MIFYVVISRVADLLNTSYNFGISLLLSHILHYCCYSINQISIFLLPILCGRSQSHLCRYCSLLPQISIYYSSFPSQAYTDSITQVGRQVGRQVGSRQVHRYVGRYSHLSICFLCMFLLPKNLFVVRSILYMQINYHTIYSTS